MRAKKSIICKVENWKSTPMLVTGLYRLFTYLPWNAVPSDYKQFFKKEAQAIWNDDLKTFKEDNIKKDMVTEIKGILTGLTTKNITQTLGIIPMVLADAFICGANIDKLVYGLLNLIKEYIGFADIDRDLAERYAILGIAEILKKVVRRVELSLDFDIDVVVKRILTHFDKFVEQVAADSSKNATRVEFDPFLDEAEDKTELVKEELTEDAKTNI
jgi:hypothetical protein